MKKYTILLALVFWGTVSAVNAQVKQITPNQFYAADRKADELMAERPRRIITKTEDLKNGVVVLTTTRTEEQIPSSDSEWFVTIETKSNDERISETIRIGSKVYRRENNGDWITGDARNGRGVGAGSIDKSVEQFTEELTSLDGVSARKLNDLAITETGKGLTFYNADVWLDQKGFFLRSEYVRGFLQPRVEIIRSVKTYEYDPKDLKIEAPIK